MSSNAIHNILRMNIIENIRLEFQRPTTVICYGTPYGSIDSITQFLAKKLGYFVVKCEIGQSLNLSELIELLDMSSNYGFLFQNYPQTFEQILSLQTLLKGSQIVVLFLNCSYAVGLFFVHNISSTLENNQSNPRGMDSFGEWKDIPRC